jgi:hypothetical protein
MGWLRSMIISKANEEIGGYGSDEYAPTRDDMDFYFQTAWHYPYSSASSHTKSHWCGIWATYILIQAGINASWGPISGGYGVSSKQVKRHNGNSGLQPGDIGYCRYINGKVADHHFLVIDVVEDYDYVECIDGNAGGTGNGFGTIRRIRTRLLSDIDCYYEILE